MKIVSAIPFVKILLSFKNFQNRFENNSLLTLFQNICYGDKSSFNLRQFQEKTGNPNFYKVTYWNSMFKKFLLCFTVSKIHLAF